MQTLSSTPQTVLTRDDSQQVALGFTCDTANVTVGTFVKLKTNGEVTPLTAATDRPVGYLKVGSKAIGDRVTVQGYFDAEAFGVADGAIANCGVLLTQVGNTGGVPKFKVAVSTNQAVAMSLSTATDTNQVRVAYLKYPVLIP